MLTEYLLSREALSAVIYFFVFGQIIFLVYFLVPFFLYLAWSVALMAIEAYLLQKQEARTYLRPYVKSLTWLGSMFVFLISAITVVGTFWVTYYPQRRADIGRFNNWLMLADKTLFGTYVPFWFHSINNPWKPYFDVVAEYILSVYQSLAFVLGACLLFLLLLNKRVFIHMLAAFFVTIIISAPFWYLFPALSPLDGYWYPLISAEIPADIQNYLSQVRVNDVIGKYAAQLMILNEQDGDWFLPITSIPSMHVAWAVLILFYAGIAWRPSLVMTVPYLLLTFLATVYTLQHYAIDLVAGVMLAGVAIMATYAIAPHKIRAVVVLFDHIDYDRQRLRVLFPKVLRRYI